MDAELLSRIAVFEDFEPHELELLASVMEPRVLAPHRIVFRKGEPAAGCYIVVAGSVDVAVEGANGRPERVSRLGPGELFGEVALLDGGPRSATCAAGPRGARLAFLGRVEFQRIFGAGSPFAYKLLDVVSRRIVERLRSAPAQLQRAMLTQQGIGPSQSWSRAIAPPSAG